MCVHRAFSDYEQQKRSERPDQPIFCTVVLMLNGQPYFFNKNVEGEIEQVIPRDRKHYLYQQIKTREARVQNLVLKWEAKCRLNVGQGVLGLKRKPVGGSDPTGVTDILAGTAPNPVVQADDVVLPHRPIGEIVVTEANWRDHISDIIRKDEDCLLYTSPSPRD